MLVLGRDDVSWFERLFMGAVTSQVVGHVACPVVVVPGNWRARHASPRLPFDRCTRWRDSAGACLGAEQFEEARLRDARLIVLHAEPMTATARDRTDRAWTLK